METLAGRVAVVTGGGSGIGRALALAFAAAGMDVAVADIDIAAAEGVRDEARALGRRAIAAHCNVAVRDEVEALADAVVAEFGAVHVVCNNAGVVRFQPLKEMTPEDWAWVDGVNLQGVVHGLQAFVPRIRAQGQGGHIVNTASIAGLSYLAGENIGSYIATKYAVVGLSEDLHRELAPEGIGVSVLCPGGVRTRILDAGRNRPQELGGPIAPPAAGRDPTGRHAPQTSIEPEEVARLVLAAIRENQLYIVTHPETRVMVEERFAAILAAWDWLAAQRQG
jgi:NAD(P)-dependent dehydrogenase (short-subunit alcohol dehydrogenase family)